MTKLIFNNHEVSKVNPCKRCGSTEKTPITRYNNRNFNKYQMRMITIYIKGYFNRRRYANMYINRRLSGGNHKKVREYNIKKDK